MTSPGEPEFEDVLPAWDSPEAAIPLAGPVEAMPLETAQPAEELVTAAPPPPSTIACPICGSSNALDRGDCFDCGYHFSPADLERARAGNAAAGPDTIPYAIPLPADAPIRLQDRFELGEKISERCGVVRYRGLDYGDGSSPPVPVIILEQKTPMSAQPVIPEPATSDQDTGEDILPFFDEVFPLGAASPVTEVLPARPAWPSVVWEASLLSLEHQGLPHIVASFTEGGAEYLVEEIPTGRPLWDAWDDPELTSCERYGYLIQVAETLHRLHQYQAILEGLRPNIVVVSPEGVARLTDLSDLLPLPLVEDVPVRGTLYTPPELLGDQSKVDARADLYSFGAMLYALHVGRELSERTDFDRPGNPKPFLPNFPDIHPAFGRLMTKTFRREPDSRFPTDEAGREDPTGFLELIRTLGVLRRTIDNVRLEIASWTTTGIVRTGNEDAYAVIHACESRQDDLGEAALVLLCDGMGGYEAGEVAAALAIQVLRQTLLQQKMFAHLAGASAFPVDPLNYSTKPEGHAGPPLDVEACKLALKAALREANKQVFTASRVPGTKRRGMGCTAEAVYVDGTNVVVGHVGDSRTYHLHEGRMIQLTRDQTLVNRLVELGTLSPEEAETHPRRNELQQAVGGQPEVEPGLYHGIMKPGDWVVVCSDGLSNHVNPTMLKEMLQSEAQSAEMAARRLVNLTNIEGATDNATVVVIRAT